jgi:hypothetical protein
MPAAAQLCDTVPSCMALGRQATLIHAHAVAGLLIACAQRLPPAKHIGLANLGHHSVMHAVMVSCICGKASWPPAPPSLHACMTQRKH